MKRYAPLPEGSLKRLSRPLFFFFERVETSADALSWTPIHEKQYAPLPEGSLDSPRPPLSSSLKRGAECIPFHGTRSMKRYAPLPEGGADSPAPSSSSLKRGREKRYALLPCIPFHGPRSMKRYAPLPEGSLKRLSRPLFFFFEEGAGESLGAYLFMDPDP